MIDEMRGEIFRERKNQILYFMHGFPGGSRTAGGAALLYPCGLFHTVNYCDRTCPEMMFVRGGGG